MGVGVTASPSTQSIEASESGRKSVEVAGSFSILWNLMADYGSCGNFPSNLVVKTSVDGCQWKLLLRPTVQFPCTSTKASTNLHASSYFRGSNFSSMEASTNFHEETHFHGSFAASMLPWKNIYFDGSFVSKILKLPWELIYSHESSWKLPWK